MTDTFKYWDIRYPLMCRKVLVTHVLKEDLSSPPDRYIKSQELDKPFQAMVTGYGFMMEGCVVKSHAFDEPTLFYGTRRVRCLCVRKYPTAAEIKVPLDGVKEI